MKQLPFDNLMNKKPTFTPKVWLAIGLSVFIALCYLLGWPFIIGQLLGNFIGHFFYLNAHDKELLGWLATLALIYFMPQINGRTALMIGMFLILIQFVHYQFEKVFLSAELQCAESDECLLVELSTGQRAILQEGETRPAGSKIIGKPTPEDLIAYDPRVEAPAVNQIFIKSKSECEAFHFIDSNQKPRVYYSYGFGNKIELFDNYGANPRTGDLNKKITRSVAENYCTDLGNQEILEQQQKAKEHALKEHAEKTRLGQEQAAKQAEIERLRRIEVVAEKKRMAEYYRLQAEELAQKRRNEKEVEAQQASENGSVQEGADPFGEKSPPQPAQTAEQADAQVNTSINPIENCAPLLRNEKATILVSCQGNCQIPAPIEQFEVPVNQYRTNTLKNGCIAYAGTENKQAHQQTLSCLLNVLGNGYYIDDECSGYVIDSSNFYEINPV